jgi:hypothetical protein
MVAAKDDRAFGLVFRHPQTAKAYLGAYSADGHITVFKHLEDAAGVFSGLMAHHFMLVQLYEPDEESEIRLREVGMVEMARPIPLIMADKRLPAVTHEIWKTVVAERQFERLEPRRSRLMATGPRPGTRLN